MTPQKYILAGGLFNCRNVTVYSPYVKTNAGQLPALQTHAWRDHVERKAVPLKGGVNGYVGTPWRSHLRSRWSFSIYSISSAERATLEGSTSECHHWRSRSSSCCKPSL